MRPLRPRRRRLRLWAASRHWTGATTARAAAKIRPTAASSTTRWSTRPRSRPARPCAGASPGAGAWSSPAAADAARSGRARVALGPPVPSQATPAGATCRRRGQPPRSATVLRLWMGALTARAAVRGPTTTRPATTRSAARRYWPGARPCASRSPRAVASSTEAATAAASCGRGRAASGPACRSPATLACGGGLWPAPLRSCRRRPSRRRRRGRLARPRPPRQRPRPARLRRRPRLGRRATRPSRASPATRTSRGRCSTASDCTPNGTLAWSPPRPSKRSRPCCTARAPTMVCAPRPAKAGNLGLRPGPRPARCQPPSGGWSRTTCGGGTRQGATMTSRRACTRRSATSASSGWRCSASRSATVAGTG
mmetsp:Transcript_109027/g.338630  ORF Transcript_109027/g.338630 Transcript_109027/m.338630 type:complete len:368 (+) Transcript_109027:479-1582(+)